MSNITDTLRAATKDILTEDVLKEIEDSFNTSVDEKVKLHVEKALLEQDDDYAKKLLMLIIQLSLTKLLQLLTQIALINLRLLLQSMKKH